MTKAIKTHAPNIDDVLGGGFQSGKLYVVKNVDDCNNRFLLSVFFAMAAIYEKHKVLACSYEKESSVYYKYARRLLPCYEGDPELFVCDRKFIDPGSFIAVLDDAVNNNGVKLIVIDNIRWIQVRDKFTYSEFLTKCAVDYDVPIVAIEHGDWFDRACFNCEEHYDGLSDLEIKWIEEEEPRVSYKAYCDMNWRQIADDKYMLDVDRIGEDRDMASDRFHLCADGCLKLGKFSKDDIDENEAWTRRNK